MSAILQSGKGDVRGPASAADGQVALFSGTTGKLIKAESNYRPGGLVFANPDTVVCGVAQTTFSQYIMPANLMSRPGDMLRVIVEWGVATNANSKVLYVIFHNHVYSSTGNFNALHFRTVMEAVYRISGEQDIFVHQFVSSGSLATNNRIIPNQPTTSPIVVRIAGNGIVAGDVFVQGCMMEFWPAP